MMALPELPVDVDASDTVLVTSPIGSLVGRMYGSTAERVSSMARESESCTKIQRLGFCGVSTDGFTTELHTNTTSVSVAATAAPEPSVTVMILSEETEVVVVC